MGHWYIGKAGRRRNTDVMPAVLPAGPGPLDWAAPVSHVTRIRVRAFCRGVRGGMGLLSGLMGSGATPKTDGALIKDSDTQHFIDDVIQASRDQPVIVDFWAP